MPLDRVQLEDLRLFAVVLRKVDLDVEFLAFAPGGRPAVFWTRKLAEGWLSECRRLSYVAAGRVEEFAPFSKLVGSPC